MLRFIVLTIMTLALFSTGRSFTEEPPPVRIITFELKDGKKFEALRFSSMGAGDLKTYLIYTLDGRKLALLEKEIVSRKEQLLPLASFPPQAQNEILQQRAAIAAAQTSANAKSEEQKVVAAAKQRENEAKAALDRARTEMIAASSRLADAEQTIKETPVALAKAEARYDAAKTELGSGTSSYYYDANRVPGGRSEHLSDVMMRAAEDKARLETAKKEAEELLKGGQDGLAPLSARVDSAMVDFAAAQAETQHMLLAIRDSDAHKAPHSGPSGTGSLNEELSIGRRGN